MVPRNNGGPTKGSWSHGWNIKQQIFAIDGKHLVVMGVLFLWNMGCSRFHKHTARVKSVSKQHIDYSKPGRTGWYWLKHLIIDCNSLWLSLVTYSYGIASGPLPFAALPACCSAGHPPILAQSGPAAHRQWQPPWKCNESKKQRRGRVNIIIGRKKTIWMNDMCVWHSLAQQVGICSGQG